MCIPDTTKLNIINTSNTYYAVTLTRMPLQPIQALISPELLSKAAIFRKMTDSMRSRLSGELAPFCWVAEVRDSTLVVVTDQAERATHLRYQQHEILKQINEEFHKDLKKPLRRLRTKIDYACSDHLAVKEKKVHSSRLKNREHCTKLREILSVSTKPR